MTQYAKVITSYEKLDADQKAKVNDTAYKGALALKQLYKRAGEQREENATKNATESPSPAPKNG